MNKTLELFLQILSEYKKEINNIPQNNSDEIKKYMSQKCVDDLVNNIIFNDKSEDLIIYSTFIKIAKEYGYEGLSIMFYHLDMEEQEKIFNLAHKMIKLIAFT